MQALEEQLPEGALVVIDTAPVVYVLEQRPVFAAYYQGLFKAAEDGRIQIALSALTVTEVLTGPLKAGKRTLANALRSALAAYDVVPVNETIAALAAELRADHALRLPDACQLATAIHLTADAFVTHDADFGRIQGIRILTAPAATPSNSPKPQAKRR